MKINRDSLLFDTKKQELNAYKNTLRLLINQAKNNYYSKQFDKNRRNGKKTCHTIDQALHRKTPKSTPDAIIIDNKLSTDRKEMADSLILISQLYVHQAKLIIQTCLRTVYISVTHLIQRFSLRKLIIEQCYSTLII